MIRPDDLKSFFKLLFGKTQGWLCIAYINPTSRSFKEKFFQYPAELTVIADDIIKNSDDKNIYFCPQLFKSGTAGSRRKDNVSVVTCAWSDLDKCHPENLLVAPSISFESSPGRYQAFWLLDEVEPAVAEDLSRRIAYAHKKHGADLSGWDLTQLLRVPHTKNMKYKDAPEVKILTISDVEYGLEDFAEYPEVHSFSKEEVGDVPDVSDIDVDDLLEAHAISLNPMVFTYYNTVPDPGKWSHALYSLEMFLFEGGFSKEQVYAVCKKAACNKFERDKRPDSHLWRDVVSAYNHHVDNKETNVEEPEKLLTLLTEAERARVKELPDGFVERYIKWASDLSDAAKQYHQAGAFTILSALLCGHVILPTSYGSIIPNLWFMILGDTTLTRKSTSMDMAVDLLSEIDPEAVMATDGTLEGLMTILSGRPKKPSVFLRDEFSGLLDSMIRKDYMAGMPEMLTKLYDGKMMKRVLKRESFEVHDPRLIMFTGGIKTKVTQILTMEHVASGFMPRFIFITAESDITRIKPIGPPTDIDMGDRDKLLDELTKIKEHYQGFEPMKIGEQELTLAMPKEHKAVLSKEAWLRYNQLEMKLTQYGMDSEMPDAMTAVGGRLANSILKAAVLMSAARQFNAKTTVYVTEDDILRAIKYGEAWRTYADEVISNVGITGDERLIGKIEAFIRQRGTIGVNRSTLLRTFKLTARQGRELLDTMVQRNIIDQKANGRNMIYYVP